MKTPVSLPVLNCYEYSTSPPPPPSSTALTWPIPRHHHLRPPLAAHLPMRRRKAWSYQVDDMWRTYLEGEDFDSVPVEEILIEFKKDSPIDLPRSRVTIQELEKAKNQASSTTQTDINLPSNSAEASSPRHVNVGRSAPPFESIVSPLALRSGPSARARKLYPTPA